MKSKEEQSQNVLALRCEIVRIEKEMESARKRRKKLLKQLQENCEHQVIIETGNVGTIMFPRRICAICSLEEQGWGCGYDKLRAEPSMIVDRDEFYRFRDLSHFKVKSESLIE